MYYDEDFTFDYNNVVPYRFEPEYTEEELANRARASQTQPTPPYLTSSMAENIKGAACESESQKAAEENEVDTCHAGLANGDKAVALEEDGVPLEIEMFVDSSHPNKVLEGLNRLRLNSALCDVILCCGGQEFPCHRYVLASFSPYFEAMFTAGMMESTQERVTISGVEPQMIGMLVSYAYTSKVSISTEHVQALLAASNMLEVTAVRDACCDYMARHIDINNCVEMYCFAEVHSLKKLEKCSLDYILQDFSVIYKQEEFLSLPVERLTDILTSDHLNVPKEDIVFEAVMLWLNKCPTRRQNFEKGMSVRLSSVPPTYTVIEALDVVKECQGCQRFISEATDRDLVPYNNTAGSRVPTVIVTVGADTYEKDIHKMESFDPLTNEWKTIGRTPKVNGHAVAISGSILYLAGGFCSYEDSEEMWRYDIPRDTWTKMAPMSIPRRNFSLVMLDGYVFAIGGSTDKEGVLMDRYDVKTDTWELMEDVGVEDHYDHDGPAVVTLDGLLYFIGGRTKNPNTPKVAKYNPETSVWTELAPMQTPRSQPAACTLNGKIYILGGQHIKECKTKVTENSMECYNPKSNQWTTCAPMQMRRYRHSMVAVNGRIYVLGGTDARDMFVMEIERYCEETDTWETMGKLQTGCYNLKCVSLRLRKDHAPTVYEDYENSQDSDDNRDDDVDYYDYDVSYEDDDHDDDDYDVDDHDDEEMMFFN